jgi:hypothetical protein
MVLLKTTLTGIAFLILGLLLLTVAGQYVTIEVQQLQHRNIEPHAEFLVGDASYRYYNLPANVPVLGTVIVTEAPTNASGDIRFMILDADNYQRWSTGGHPDSILQTQKQGAFNFTFTTPKDGVYYFVFDNTASLFKKYVILTVAYNEITTSRVPDIRANYVSWALIIIGALIFAYGLVGKPRVTWG